MSKSSGFDYEAFVYSKNGLSSEKDQYLPYND